jgi:hypothetical protein
MLISHRQNAGQNYGIKPANRLFYVAKLKYLGTTVTNQDLIQEEIKRLNSCNACYHSVENLLLSHLLSNNILVKVEICRIIILPVVLYGYGTWPLILGEEHRLKVLRTGC